MMQTALPSFAAATEDHSARRFIIKLAENADDLHGYAVASNWRGVPGLSAGLIRMAVCTAHTLGCQKFLANVQRQNVPLFRRLHWKSIGMIDVCGLPHHLMQADLEHYPPQASS
jgi:putative N-acetyltransferase (TIGR04045 family)